MKLKDRTRFGVDYARGGVRNRINQKNGAKLSNGHIIIYFLKNTNIDVKVPFSTNV